MSRKTILLQHEGMYVRQTSKAQLKNGGFFIRFLSHHFLIQYCDTFGDSWVAMLVSKLSTFIIYHL